MTKDHLPDSHETANQGHEVVSQFLTCGNCNELLPLDTVSSCPKCGSNKQHLKIEILEQARLEIHDTVKAKVVDPIISAKKRVRQQIFVGADHRVSQGDWVEKERVIDRDRDWYKETVKDKTGKIIHKDEGKLSDHKGHGSDKPKP